MSKDASLKARSDVQTLAEAISPVPTLLADERVEDHEALSTALWADLAAVGAYERALARNVIHIEWELLRHQLIRNARIRTMTRDRLARALSYRDTDFALSEPTAEDSKTAHACLAGDADARARIEQRLGEICLTLDEVVAAAHADAADETDHHERRIADLERRRRRLMDDHGRLKAARLRAPADDAEIVGGAR